MKIPTFDLHDEKTKKYVIIIAVISIAILALLVRKSMVSFQNVDYQIFATWYDYVKIHGISSFDSAFSNYNPPYTYFLYFVTLLPIGKLLAIKGLLVLFDLLLAFSVYLVVKAVRPKGYSAIAAGLGSLFLPVVLATGVMWGQFDQLYTAFILFSLYYLIKNNSKFAWLFFGVAMAIKLQAIFFLPVLLVMSFKRIRLKDCWYGIVAFMVLTFLPMLFGRSFGSILRIYSDQTNLFNGRLTLEAANIYQWVPNSAFSFFNDAGIYLAMAAMAAYLVYTLIYNKFSNKDLLIGTALIAFLLPFILPQMHERYFFQATIAIFIAAFVSRSLIWAAIGLQLVTLFSYIPFLFSYQYAPPLPMGVLALVNLAILAALIVAYIKPNPPLEQDLSDDKKLPAKTAAKKSKLAKTS